MYDVGKTSVGSRMSSSLCRMSSSSGRSYQLVPNPLVFVFVERSLPWRSVPPTAAFLHFQLIDSHPNGGNQQQPE